MDTYSRVAHCKLYTSKTPITVADQLNDRVLPFYDVQGLPMLIILTDRCTEYRGKVEQHVVTPGYAGVTEFKTYRKAVRKLSINRTPALSLRLGRAAV